jgi:hypothetical protein
LPEVLRHETSSRNRHRSPAIALFDSTENLKKWQPCLQEFEHLSGDPGQVGSKSRMVHLMGKRECEMVETITKRDFPEEFCGTCEAKGVWNSVDNRFEELDGGRMRWHMVSEFRFTGFMKQFNEFAESEGVSE